MALAKDRVTPSKTTGLMGRYKVNGGSKIFQGSLVALDTDGYARPGVDTASFVCAGRAREQVDNSGGADGDKSVDVEQGVFKWKNSGGNAVAQAHIGRVCYVEDDETVKSAVGNGVIAGIVVAIDSDGVWVATFSGMTGAAITGYPSNGAIETVTTGALDPAKRTSLVSIDGTKAYTLANGTIEGQRKTLRVIAATNTPDGTLTPATFADGASIDLDAVNECVELEYHATGGWRVVFIVGATITP